MPSEPRGYKDSLVDKKKKPKKDVLRGMKSNWNRLHKAEAIDNALDEFFKKSPPLR